MIAFINSVLQTPATIRSAVLVNVSITARPKLPSVPAFRDQIHRVRVATNHVPPDPTSSSELIIPDECKFYDGKRFLMLDSFDSDPDKPRILMFGKEDNAEWFDRVDRLFVDGTFKVSF